MTGKTLKELNVQPGDVVTWWVGERVGVANFVYTVGIGNDGVFVDAADGQRLSGGTNWHLISRASDTPKLWRDMTPEEKGALLLAHHEGKVIEFCNDGEWDEANTPAWHPDFAYRVSPEPKVETVILYGGDHSSWVSYIRDGDSHRITFNLIDGKPDCDSVKMEEL